MLPILDGLDDGEQFARQLFPPCAPEEGEPHEAVVRWMGVYAGVRERLMTLLADIGITRMTVTSGMPMDYLRFMPFDVESDPELDNESVKSATRAGYQYQEEAEGAQNVLRPAQVIVVKN